MVVLHAIILMLIQAFVWILLAYCILSMLLGFGILDVGNRFFYSVFNALARIVEPVALREQARALLELALAQYRH